MGSDEKEALGESRGPLGVSETKVFRPSPHSLGQTLHLVGVVPKHLSPHGKGESVRSSFGCRGQVDASAPRPSVCRLSVGGEVDDVSQLMPNEGVEAVYGAAKSLLRESDVKPAWREHLRCGVPTRRPKVRRVSDLQRELNPRNEAPCDALNVQPPFAQKLLDFFRDS